MVVKFDKVFYELDENDRGCIGFTIQPLQIKVLVSFLSFNFSLAYKIKGVVSSSWLCQAFKHSVEI